MKRVIIAMLFMLPVLAFAEKKPAANLADYTITVHVQSSQLVDFPGIQEKQLLEVVIDGKKYELEVWSFNNVLPVGDYKARVSQDKIYPDKSYVRVYELLFADGTTRKYTVMGETE